MIKLKTVAALYSIFCCKLQAATYNKMPMRAATVVQVLCSGSATLWQSSANAPPVCCNALPVALLVF